MDNKLSDMTKCLLQYIQEANFHSDFISRLIHSENNGSALPYHYQENSNAWGTDGSRPPRGGILMPSGLTTTNWPPQLV